MDPVYDSATSDAEAILVCLGAMAAMALHAERIARCSIGLRESKDSNASEIGAKMLDSNKSVLESVRKKIDAAMQELGEHFNNEDSCSATMATVTKPVFEVLRKRAAGISLND